LSYTLDDMWAQMVRTDDGVLRLPAQSFELGGVLVDRADKFLAAHPGAEDALRRVLTLRLAAVRDDGEPTRRRAARAEFSDEEWRLVSELADYPNRLLVTAAAAGETYAEVAHEAIFRRWGTLREWIAAEREFLIWRSGLEAARRAWQAAPQRSKNDALLMGFALSQARTWLAKRAADLPPPDRDFIALSRKTARRRSLRMRVLVGGLALPIALVALVVVFIVAKVVWREFEVVRPFMQATMMPHVLTATAEATLKPGDVFRECAVDAGTDYCPPMVVVPAGSFMMGSTTPNLPNQSAALPQHKVSIAAPFAVSKYELTFGEWDTCVNYGDCGSVDDAGYGRARQPVINISWVGAQRYVAWLSKVTGKPYRLLSEAEYEYATRAGTQTLYPWGDELGKNNANCKDCGSPWDGGQTAPVGSFAANGFGLYDMVGNVFEWVGDCWHDNFDGAPADGSAWVTGDCSKRVIRAGSWYYPSALVQSFFRYWVKLDASSTGTGFRVARALVPATETVK
jgi:formylglycine-generating enzyme required for sulfatase activity